MITGKLFCFQLFEHNKNNRIAVARQLKDALKAKTAVQKDRIIYVTVPAMGDHFGHSVGLVCNSLILLFLGQHEVEQSEGLMSLPRCGRALCVVHRMSRVVHQAISLGHSD